MIVKVHAIRGKKIVVIVDAEILGKRFEQGVLQLDLKADFYRGEEKSDDEIKKSASNADIIQAVGEKSVNFAVRNGWVDKKRTILIDKIPYAESIYIE